MDNRIRLVLVDDQALFRESLARFLATQPGLEVAGERGMDAENLDVLTDSTIDLVLLDLDRRARRGTEFMAAARAVGYKGRFLIVAEAAEPKDVAAVIKLGASGVFLKCEAPDRLVQAIRIVASGASWVDERVIRALADRMEEHPRLENRSGNKLSDKEERVLLGLLGGLSNRKIGEQIGLSESSVKSVLQQLFVRAAVRTRSQLVRAALEGSLGSAHEWTKTEDDVLTAGSSEEIP